MHIAVLSSSLLFVSLLLGACGSDTRGTGSPEPQQAPATTAPTIKETPKPPAQAVEAPAPGTPPEQKASAPQDAAATLPQLVFYLNPRGAPCQAQERILQDMASELQGKVTLVHRKTDQPADREHFMKAGIRGLPSLVLTDASGAELGRTPAGVQDAASIRALLSNR